MNCLMVSQVGLEMMLVYIDTLKGGTIVMSPLRRCRGNKERARERIKKGRSRADWTRGRMREKGKKRRAERAPDQGGVVWRKGKQGRGFSERMSESTHTSSKLRLILHSTKHCTTQFVEGVSQQEGVKSEEQRHLK